MNSVLRKAHADILLRALLSRSLRSVAMPYAKLAALAQKIEDESEKAQHGILTPVWSFIEDLDGLIDEIETKTGKEFPAEDANLSDRMDEREACTRLAKILKDISGWADKIAKKTKKVDDKLHQSALSARDQAFRTAVNFESWLIPESNQADLDVQEKSLLEEYKRLAGIKVL